MISLRAAIVRAAIKIYTYPYRKRFASLSRSIALKIVRFYIKQIFIEARGAAERRFSL